LSEHTHDQTSFTWHLITRHMDEPEPYSRARQQNRIASPTLIYRRQRYTSFFVTASDSFQSDAKRVTFLEYV
jgi:hypothetical protein